MNRTFETRLDLRGEKHQSLAEVLNEYAALMGRVERTIYAKLKAGREWKGDLHTTLYKKFNITSTHLSTAHRSLLARLSSISELAKQHVQSLDVRIRSKTGDIAKKVEALKAERENRTKLLTRISALEDKLAIARAKLDASRPSQRDKRLAALKKGLAKLHETEAEMRASLQHAERLDQQLHQYRRKLENLKQKREDAIRQMNDPSICFGSKKLFRKQFHLEANGLPSHSAWREEWRAKRSGNLWFEGDRSAEYGNPFARLKLRQDSLFDLELRLPEALSHLATHSYRAGNRIVHSIYFHELSFNHDQLVIAKALANEQPITIRFLRDDKSWKVMVTVKQVTPAVAKDFSRGAIGVDVNAGFVSVSRVDKDGNFVETFDIAMVTYGKSEAQSRDIVRKVAAQIATYARRHNLPIISERIDFQGKKDRLKTDDGAKYARMLSSFVYSAFDAALASSCARAGVYHARVNPAYTSIIGRTKFAARYGLTVHAAAAVTIARRAMRLSERLPRSVEEERRVTLLLNNAHRVTLGLPARKDVPEQAPKSRHVWSAWNEVNRAFKGALAAHGPSRRKRPRPKAVVNGSSGRNDLRSMVHRQKRDVLRTVAQPPDQRLGPGADEIPFLIAS